MKLQINKSQAVGLAKLLSYIQRSVCTITICSLNDMDIQVQDLEKLEVQINRLQHAAMHLKQQF